MSQQYKAKSVIIGAVVVLFIAMIGVVIARQSKPDKNSALTGITAIVYRSPSCGCCKNYINYLRGYGIRVEERLENNMTLIMKQYNVPGSLASCHTTEIGGYIVEGHIPVEAILKLITEKPSVAGIGMAGMPSGSPGMPGAKTEPFEIKEFTADGSTSPFVTL